MQGQRGGGGGRYTASPSPAQLETPQQDGRGLTQPSTCPLGLAYREGTGPHLIPGYAAAHLACMPPLASITRCIHVAVKYSSLVALFCLNRLRRPGPPTPGLLTCPPAKFCLNRQAGRVLTLHNGTSVLPFPLTSSPGLGTRPGPPISGSSSGRRPNY
ncbi:unnamed protein product [Boreogadus saida]